MMVSTAPPPQNSKYIWGRGGRRGGGEIGVSEGGGGVRGGEIGVSEEGVTGELRKKSDKRG